MATLTDLKHGKLIDLLKGRSKQDIRTALQHMKYGDRVQFVAIDMTRAYADVVKDVFPNAQIVVDKRHVLNLARKAMDRVRIDTRRNLSRKSGSVLFQDRFLLNTRSHDLTDEQKSKILEWKRLYPKLIKAYELKESFFNVYQYSTWPSAWSAFNQWCHDLDKAGMGSHFLEPRKAFVNWKIEISNYWAADKVVTNALTETRNGNIRQLIREGRGYSFRVLRAKALHKYGHWTTDEIHIRKAAEAVPKMGGYEFDWLAEIVKGKLGSDLLPLSTPLPSHIEDDLPSL